ncbi:hypothetical protein ADZ36_06475 [Streptomyces fradiae]|uniref:Uncharacterized protein n=2 Tax=Streptomyces TaxID=1883 RepID=A0A3R7ET13_9ACTN|nr:hypothetical protein ADZ36_06475 [Streptomyces fradiae]PQM20829.1 hypothetical protein Sfr7A_24835 [Streptomyces xinghaiensis]RKM95854.1 hypothetical protein SFRA_012490 [Streptomyces xinghaiensis]RNC70834.1 hypothetical protein DC095_024265 [Streptomyces xinghaiensis]
MRFRTPAESGRKPPPRGRAGRTGAGGTGGTGTGRTGAGGGTGTGTGTGRTGTGTGGTGTGTRTGATGTARRPRTGTGPERPAGFGRILPPPASPARTAGRDSCPPLPAGTTGPRPGASGAP